MTNHVVRLYAFAGSVLVLFLTWATIAAKPWASHAAPKADPRWAALAEASGKPVVALAANWTEQPGFPVVLASTEGTGGAP